MPDVYGPFTSATWGQGPWFRDKGPLEPSGVAGAVASTAGTGELGLTTAGLVGSLSLGRAHVRGAGYERTGTAWSYTHPANTHATQSRIDRYVLRRDLVAQTVVPAVLQGTPAATPLPVAPTQNEDGTWELPLHQVTVPPASGTVLTVVDERRWLPQWETSRSGLLEYQSGYGVQGAPYPDCFWHLSPDGVVTLGGLVKRTGANVALTIGTIYPVLANMPAEIRRSTAIMTDSIIALGNVPDVYPCRIYVAAASSTLNVIPMSTGSGTIQTTVGYIALDGVSWALR